MTQDEVFRMWMEINRSFAFLEQTVGPTVLQQAEDLRQNFNNAVNSNNLTGLQTAFQSLYFLAATQIRNPALLTAFEPFLQPTLGFVGVSGLRIRIAAAAVLAAIEAPIFGYIVFGMLIIVLAAIVIWLLLWLLRKFIDGWNWVPARPQQEMRQSNWKNLIDILNDSTYGPVYAINTGTTPSGISILELN